MKMPMLAAVAVVMGAAFAGAATVKVEPAHARTWDQAAYDNCMDTLCIPQYEIGKGRCFSESYGGDRLFCMYDVDLTYESCQTMCSYAAGG